MSLVNHIQEDWNDLFKNAIRNNTTLELKKSTGSISFYGRLEEELIIAKDNSFYFERYYHAKNTKYNRGCQVKGNIMNGEIINFDHFIYDEKYSYSDKYESLNMVIDFLLPYFSKEVLFTHLENSMKDKSYYFKQNFINWFKINSFNISFLLDFIEIYGEINEHIKYFPLLDFLFDTFNIISICNSKKSSIVKKKLLIYFEENKNFNKKFLLPNYFKGFLLQILPNNLQYNDNINRIINENNIDYNDIFYKNLKWYIKYRYGDLVYTQVEVLKNDIKNLEHNIMCELLENLDISDLIFEDEEIISYIDNLFRFYESVKTCLNPLKVLNYCIDNNDFRLIKLISRNINKECILKINNDNLSLFGDNLKIISKNIALNNKNLETFNKFIIVVRDELVKNYPNNIFGLKEIYDDLLKKCDEDLLEFIKKEDINIYNKYEKEYFNLTDSFDLKIEVFTKYGKGCGELTSETSFDVFYSIEDFIYEYFSIKKSKTAKQSLNDCDFIRGLLNSDFGDDEYGISHTISTNIPHDCLEDMLKKIPISKQNIDKLNSINISYIFQTGAF